MKFPKPVLTVNSKGAPICRTGRLVETGVLCSISMNLAHIQALKCAHQELPLTYSENDIQKD